jgi:hypothetical protein
VSCAGRNAELVAVYTSLKDDIDEVGNSGTTLCYDSKLCYGPLLDVEAMETSLGTTIGPRPSLTGSRDFSTGSTIDSITALSLSFAI